MDFTVLPAVDVVDGQAVRLDQGEAGTEKSYGAPLEAALQWQEQGLSGCTLWIWMRRSAADPIMSSWRRSPVSYRSTWS